MLYTKMYTKYKTKIMVLICHLTADIKPGHAPQSRPFKARVWWWVHWVGLAGRTI